MVTYMGARPLVPGDRLYDVIHNLWITFDALCIASLAVEGKPIPDNESDQLTFITPSPLMLPTKKFDSCISFLPSLTMTL